MTNQRHEIFESKESYNSFRTKEEELTPKHYQFKSFTSTEKFNPYITRASNLTNGELKVDVEEIYRSSPSEASEIETKKQTLSKNILKSREIHKQLMNKRNRWKPTELELAILKMTFEQNQYPSKEEKLKLLKVLEEKFKSKIDMNQLNRWFQHQRERSIKAGNDKIKKNTYKKFDKEELKLLEEIFTKNNYPKTEEMIELAKKLGASLSKIENWYKHKRRSLAKKGLFKLKNKRYFKKDELQYLQKMFILHPRPTKEIYKDIAMNLNCDESHIKNWYSNRRKKQKLNLKKNASLAGMPILSQSISEDTPRNTGVQIPDSPLNASLGMEANRLSNVASLNNLGKPLLTQMSPKLQLPNQPIILTNPLNSQNNILPVSNTVSYYFQSPMMAKQVNPQLLNFNPNFGQNFNPIYHAVPTIYIPTYQSFQQSMNLNGQLQNPNYFPMNNGGGFMINGNLASQFDPKLSQVLNLNQLNGGNNNGNIASNNNIQMPTIDNPKLINPEKSNNLHTPMSLANMQMFANNHLSSIPPQNTALLQNHTMMQAPTILPSSLLPNSNLISSSNLLPSPTPSTEAKPSLGMGATFNQQGIPVMTGFQSYNNSLVGCVPMVNNLTNLNQLQSFYNNTSNEIFINNPPTTKTTQFNNINNFGIFNQLQNMGHKTMAMNEKS